MDRARLSDPPVSPRARRGLTFVEVMIVVVILAIVALTGISAAGGGHASKLIAAAQTLAADIDYARAESAAHGDALRVLVVHAANDRYHIALAGAPATPTAPPVTTAPYRLESGPGTAMRLTGVTISNASLGGDDHVQFGIYGQLDQTTNATITLSAGNRSITITLDAVTGQPSIGTVN